MSDFRGTYAIAGVGQTAYGELPGRSSYSLNLEAIKAATDDAGLTLGDIDGVFCKYPTSKFESIFAAKIAQQLGIYPKVIATLDQAGASNISLIAYAAMAIEAGMCEVAVCSYGDNPATKSRAAYGRPRGEGAPFGMFGTPSGYALIAQRHMYEYGTTSQQLGAIAVAARTHAALNPHAQFRRAITLADHQNSRMLADPLHLLDACPITDGGAAVIITSAARARSLRSQPVVIRQKCNTERT
jgi:acetyl-CoA acetyltransferase